MQGLTTRGRCLFAAGIASAVCAALIGEHDLLRVAVFLTALPVIAFLAMSCVPLMVAGERRIAPDRTSAGARIQITLTLHNGSRWPVTGLRLIDNVPFNAGGPAYRLISHVPAHNATTVQYGITPAVRGRYEVGPLKLTRADPFGVVELSRQIRSTASFLVTPAVLPLTGIPMIKAGSASVTSIQLAGVNDDDLTEVRDYRYGDDLRRVHWPSTARTGILMVRRAGYTMPKRATVVLDTRHHAHDGQGPDSSFEWAVSAAASLTIHLQDHGYAVRLRTSTSAGVRLEETDGIDHDVLSYLADIDTSDEDDFCRAVAVLESTAPADIVITVVGSLDAASAETLDRLTARTSTRIAFELQVSSWTNTSAESGELTTLKDYGWHAVAVTCGSSLPTLWASLSTAVPDAWR